ncbi:MAG: translation elongation factor Ts [Spirochaetaceae bacterium 4572_7]|nr:MAG: translation elongation factor Ts [Spirochaetaceae bacterium 4572_7]
MAVSPQDVKKLREATGAGMLDCKNALVATDGDFKAAEKHLKEQGLANAGNRSDRATNEGGVFTRVSGNKAVLVQITCETDFVAKNDNFKKAGETVLDAIFENGYTEPNTELAELLKEYIALLKENMTVKTVKVMNIAEGELVVDYVHSGIVAVLTKVKTSDVSNEAVKAFAFDCALHVAAFQPPFFNRAAVDASYLKEQEDIFATQTANLGKPEKIVAGIVKGKINKHLSQICFVDQKFVKNDKISVSDAAKEVAKETGLTVELVDYALTVVGK